MNPARDEGDLFTRRPSVRKLRVLIDAESLTAPAAYLDEHLEGLLGYDNIEFLYVAMSEATAPTTDTEDPPDRYVQIRDVTRHKGRFSFPGPCYAWAIATPRPKFDGRTTKASRGTFSPEPQLKEALLARHEGRFDGLRFTDDDVRRTVLLTELCRSISYDLVISESPTTGIDVVPANSRANVATRADAIPIVAHYLRTQQRYLVHAPGHVYMTRRNFFDEAVGALAEGVRWWLGKCQLGMLLSPHGSRFVRDAESVVDRLSRALRARDSLIASIGAIQTEDVVDDGADALDHCLLCLCGAVDVLARSLHAAQQLKGSERNAKLHLSRGYQQLVAAYELADGIEDLHQLQQRINVVFSLRNSIHSQTLAAIASLQAGASGVPRFNVGQIDIIIPAEAVSEMEASTARGLDFWGARKFAPGVVVIDLMELVDHSFGVIFEFLDCLCQIIAAESITDKEPILAVDAIGVRADSLEFSREQRLYLGLATPDGSAASTDPREPTAREI